MGNVAGCVRRYDRDELGMTPVEWEMVTRLVAAYPAHVPYDRCVHLSNGEWGGQDRAGGIAFEVRQRLGAGAVETAFRRGYRAGPVLVDLIRGPGESPPSSEGESPVAGGGTGDARPPASPRRSRVSTEPHRGRQDLIMNQMEAACREAVGL